MKTSLYKHYFNCNVCWKGVLKKANFVCKRKLLNSENKSYLIEK